MGQVSGRRWGPTFPGFTAGLVVVRGCFSEESGVCLWLSERLPVQSMFYLSPGRLVLLLPLKHSNVLSFLTQTDGVVLFLRRAAESRYR